MKYIFSFRSYCYLVGISFLTVMFQSEMEQQFFFAMDRKNKEVTGSKKRRKEMCFNTTGARARIYYRECAAPSSRSRQRV